MYYSYADYQGSLIALTDKDGAVVEKYAYDPWGARRNPTNWNEKDNRLTWLIDRGYTGHEHIDKFNIINMNGRVYDPLTAQFLSPDPYVQAPGNWLNYNRYSYCFGNPFKYTDPSGEFVATVLCAVIPGAQFLLPYAVYVDAALWSGTFNVISNWGDITKNGNIDSGKFWAYAGLGAANGIGAATGNIWVIGATSMLEAGGNRFVNNDYIYNDQVLKDGIYGATTSMLLHGITAPVNPSSKFATKGLDLDGKLQKAFQKGLSEKTSKHLANSVFTFGYTYASESVYNKYLADDNDELSNPFQTAVTNTLFSFGFESLQDASSQIIEDKIFEQKQRHKIDQDINSSYKYKNSGIYREYNLETPDFKYTSKTYQYPQFNYQLFKPYKIRSVRIIYKRNK